MLFLDKVLLEALLEGSVVVLLVDDVLGFFADFGTKAVLGVGAVLFQLDLFEEGPFVLVLEPEMRIRVTTVFARCTRTR